MDTRKESPRKKTTKKKYQSYALHLAMEIAGHKVVLLTLSSIMVPTTLYCIGVTSEYTLLVHVAFYIATYCTYFQNMYLTTSEGTGIFSGGMTAWFIWLICNMISTKAPWPWLEEVDVFITAFVYLSKCSVALLCFLQQVRVLSRAKPGDMERIACDIVAVMPLHVCFLDNETQWTFLARVALFCFELHQMNSLACEDISKGEATKVQWRASFIHSQVYLYSPPYLTWILLLAERFSRINLSKRQTPAYTLPCHAEQARHPTSLPPHAVATPSMLVWMMAPFYSRGNTTRMSSRQGFDRSGGAYEDQKKSHYSGSSSSSVSEYGPSGDEYIESDTDSQLSVERACAIDVPSEMPQQYMDQGPRKQARRSGKTEDDLQDYQCIDLETDQGVASVRSNTPPFVQEERDISEELDVKLKEAVVELGLLQRSGDDVRVRVDSSSSGEDGSSKESMDNTSRLSRATSEENVSNRQTFKRGKDKSRKPSMRMPRKPASNKKTKEGVE